MKSAIEFMHERAALAARELLARAPAGSIRAVFAGGSVGRDEVWWEREGDRLIVYSDLDVYAVLADHGDAVAVRRAAAEAAALLPHQIEGVVFHRGAEIGVYRVEDLRAQPVRPGTSDLAEHHRWLYGDREVLRGVGVHSGRAMARDEALYLLENRAWDALEAVAQATAEPRRARATAAKVVLDVAAAHLIADGRFRPTIAERVAETEARPPATIDAHAREAVVRADRIRRGERAIDVDASDALALAAGAWVALARVVLVGSAHDPTTLLANRCRRGVFVGNAREFVRLARRGGSSVGAAVLASARFGELAPVSALRTHAIARALTESGAATAGALAFHAGYVARLATFLGCAEGTLDERVHAALRAVS